MFAQAHVWWHIFVFLTGYTLYWLLYKSIIHVEMFPNGEEGH